MKQKKTNAARRLDELKIAYRLMEYTVDEEHLDAVHADSQFEYKEKLKTEHSHC